MADKISSLKREIGLWGLSANIVNIMIGAGIYILPAVVAEGLGASSIYAYLFCGFLITLVMMCFAVVGSRITDSGGSYTYIEKIFGRYPGFITASLFLLASLTADAAVANVVANIFISVFPLPEDTAWIIRIAFFIVLFGGLGYINIVSLKEGIGLVKIITLLKIIPLLIIVSIGLKDVTMSNLYIGAFPSLQNIGETSLILFFAFQGAETGLSVSGEVKNPNKTIPDAIRISVLVVLAIYLLIQMVSYGVAGDALAGFKENPLAEVADQVFGPIGFTLITIGAVVSMIGNLSSEVLSVPRVLFAASKDEIIPVKILSLVHPKYKTPYVAIIAYAGIGFIMASLGGFKQLAIISSASTLLIYLGVSLAAMKIRFSKKFIKSKDFFNIPGGYTIPVLSSLAITWFLSNLAKNELMVFTLFTLALSLIYVLINYKRITFGWKK